MQGYAEHWQFLSCFVQERELHYPQVVLKPMLRINDLTKMEQNQTTAKFQHESLA